MKNDCTSCIKAPALDIRALIMFVYNMVKHSVPAANNKVKMPPLSTGHTGVLRL